MAHVDEALCVGKRRAGLSQCNELVLIERHAKGHLRYSVGGQSPADPSSTGIGMPNAYFDVRIAKADFTWLTLGAEVNSVVRKRL